MYSSSQQTIYLSDRKVKLVCFVNDFHQPNNCTIEKLSDVLFYLFFSSLIQCDLPPLRPHCGEAPRPEIRARDGDLAAETLTTRPPQLLVSELIIKTKHLSNSKAK